MTEKPHLYNKSTQLNVNDCNNNKLTTFNNLAQLFHQVLVKAGLPYDGTIRPAKEFTRYKQEGDKGRPCWYIFNIEPTTGTAYGAFGCWKRGISEKWSSLSQKDFKKLTPKEQKVIAEDREKQAKLVKELQAKIRKEAKEAFAKDLKTWVSHLSLITNAPKHLHLTKKQVKQHNAMRLQGVSFNGQRGDWLGIPMYDMAGNIINLQGILPDGTKRFYQGLPVEGAYIFGNLKNYTGKAYICEGFTTGASIHEATDLPVIVAFGCGRLLEVATEYMGEYPKIKFINFADNDHSKKDNKGLLKAKEMAKKIGLPYIFLDFKEGDTGSDANDYACKHGRETLKQQIVKLKRNIPEKETEEEAITRLANLPMFEYDSQRKEEAKNLNVRVKTLDGEVKKHRQSEQAEEDTSQEEYRQGVEPYSDDFIGRELANTICQFFTKYTVLPKNAEHILTLWIIGTYCFNSFRIFPCLCLTSPEKRCGKTTTLSLLDGLVNKSLLASNITPSAIFRSIESWAPTLLIDEADTFLNGNDELRGILNSGHTKNTAYVVRTEGDSNNREPKRFNTYAPRAIACIKMPPDPIADRSIIIPLKRKLISEKVKRLPLSFKDDCLELRQKCTAWANKNKHILLISEPSVPETSSDRANDNWQPPFAIADLLGGEWPNYAKISLTKFADIKGNDDESEGICLIKEIIPIIKKRTHKRIHSLELLNELKILEGGDWANRRYGDGLTVRRLANLLSPYDIKARQLKVGTVNKNGYELADFDGVIERYRIDKSFSKESVHSADVKNDSDGDEKDKEGWGSVM